MRDQAQLKSTVDHFDGQVKALEEAMLLI